MNLFLLDEQLNRIKPITVYESLTWNTFYKEEGNFTLVIPIFFSSYLLPKGNRDLFIENTADKNIGVIESLEKITNEDNQKYIEVKGRLAVGLLDRRVSLYSKEYEDKSPTEIINSFLVSNYINPSNALRKIPLLEYINAKQPILPIVDYKLERGIDGLEMLKSLAKISDFGFYMGLNQDATKLSLNLYTGVDRSLSQNKVKPFVIQQQQNIVIQIDYFRTIVSHKTWAEIDKENKVKTTYSNAPNLSGLKRKETYFDLSSISQTITKEDGTQIIIKDKYYENMIKNEAKSKLAALIVTEYLDSELNRQISERFKSDVYLGDTITIKDDEIGFNQDMVITGATEIWSNKGYEVSLQIGQNAL